MHTIEELEATDFRYTSNGQVVERDAVLPSISITDRVGVLMGSGAEGLGGAAFLLSCVIDFYDTLGERQDEVLEYPDFYTVQATDDPADYRMFDVYPDHKNVVVEADAEAILRAVNDRGITTLLVPDRPQQSPEIEAVTRRSAERTIEQAYLYRSSGQIEGDGFEITLPRQAVGDWFEATVESMADPPSEVTRPVQPSQPDWITQGYRRISLEQALERLPPLPDG